MSDLPCKTPLLDLLRDVPEDARAEYEHSQFHHSLIPYGRLCSEAAAEIGQLREFLENMGIDSSAVLASEKIPVSDERKFPCPECHLKVGHVRGCANAV
jgi:hypothetical protein